MTDAETVAYRAGFESGRIEGLLDASSLVGQMGKAGMDAGATSDEAIGALKGIHAVSLVLLETIKKRMGK